MSTATINVVPSGVLFHRFVWKEYRMLRGFWFAVGGLGVLMQLFSAQTMFDPRGLPVWLFATAWGAAALYAIGAAVTLFSAEREEQTRDFLMLLPGRWLPMFAGKVSIAIVSSFALAAVLAVTGWLIGGGVWPNVDKLVDTLAVGGVAVIEATAWGLLFSLWLKQPLLAAVTAMGAASLGAQLAIVATPHTVMAVTIDSYRHAVPMRLLLAMGVLLADGYLGSRWLRPDRQGNSRKLGLRALLGKSSVAAGVATSGRGTRRKVMVRLLWQTWHESWRTMLAAALIAIFLMGALALTLGLFHLSADNADVPTPLLTLLFLPALFGALVFRADVRGDPRQFLLAHAVGPRYVWLARHLFWGAGILVITVAASVAIWAAVSLEVKGDIDRIFRDRYSGNFWGGVFLDRPQDEPWRLVSLLNQLLRFAMQFTFAIWTSFFTAYALGQFFSLMLRREVLAGLLALLASVVLVAWVIVVGAWQLSFWWFVLPIGVGAMLATWLRMPNWVVGRNRPRTWVLPVVALVVPLVLVVSRVPSARLSQLEEEPGPVPFRELVQFREEVREYEASRSAGQATADAYFRLHASLEEAASEDARQAVVEQLMELTKRPECRFPEAAILGGWPQYGRQISDLQESLFEDARRLQQEGDLEAALDRYLAVVRLKSHWHRGQIWINAAREQKSFSPMFLEWATHPDQTSELLRKAAAELEKCPELVADVREVLLAKRQQIRAVVLGDEPPSYSQQKHPHWPDKLAYLANQLPGERQRALLALDIRMKQLLDHVLTAVDDPTPYWHSIDIESRRAIMGRWYRRVPEPHKLVYGNDWGEYSQATQTALQTSTSYLVTREIYQRMNIRYFLLDVMDTKAQRYGLITQLALLAYRLDHQRYPETLVELKPEYLSQIPLDPYSDSPLEYRPQGFDLPLMKSDYLYYQGDEVPLIPKQVPLLWSVGIADREPQERLLTFLHDDDFGRAVEEERESIEALELKPQEYMIQRPPIVFTLPKNEPREVEAADDQPEEKEAEEVEE